jgi:LysR family transcriptional regulator, transcription activator of glutamate synthase operon
MRLGQLEYILEVAKTGTISEAAQNLHISTSTVSEAISNFEGIYGIKLFKRSRLGTVPTEEGKKVIAKAFEIQNKVFELEKEVKSFTAVTEEKLTILCSSALLQTLLPKALSTFKKAYPDVHFEIREHLNSYPIIEELKKNETDLGIITINENTWVEWEKSYKDIIHFETISQGRVYVSVNKSSPLAFKDYITPEELLGHPLILYANTRKIYDDIVKQYGQIEVLFETSNTEIIKNMVREGLGITFWSDISMKDDLKIVNDQIVHIPLVNYERSNVTYGWAYFKKRKLSPVGRAFIKILSQHSLN